MSRLKIEDLPVMEDLDEKQAKGIFGGLSLSYGGTSLSRTATTYTVPTYQYNTSFTRSTWNLYTDEEEEVQG